MTGLATAADEWTRYRRAAHDDGLVTALALLCETACGGTPPQAPCAYAVLPAGSAGAAAGDVVTTLTVADGDIVALRTRPGDRPGTGGDAWAAWALGLTCVRFGVSERLFDDAVAYLDGRTAGDTKLLHQQMVKGAVADAVIGQLEIETMLTGAAPGDLDDTVLTGLNAQITENDRALLRLLGAASFLADGPGQLARASELLADVYFGPARAVAGGEAT